MSRGRSRDGVDDPAVPALACARFPTIHRPNYYFHWLDNANGTSSGESENP
jgi:hypothetical protein